MSRLTALCVRSELVDRTELSAASDDVRLERCGLRSVESLGRICTESAEITVFAGHGTSVKARCVEGVLLVVCSICLQLAQMQIEEVVAVGSVK